MVMPPRCFLTQSGACERYYFSTSFSLVSRTNGKRFWKKLRYPHTQLMTVKLPSKAVRKSHQS